MKVLIAGDYYPYSDSDISSVKPILAAADYTIANYESPVASAACSPIPKCGPHLKSAASDVEKLRGTGFDCVTLANNHVLDYGAEGLEDTFRALDSAGFDRVGAGCNLADAARILYKTIGSETLAVINCCEHEFSVAGVDSPGTNPLDAVSQYRAIRQAKEKADYVLVIVHGGHEHYKLPSPRMQELYRFFVDAGADAVVNHHQHFYSGYEVYAGKPVFYGLGNFCFPLPKPSKDWQEGYMVTLDFTAGGVGFSLHPYIQNKEVGVRLMDQAETRAFQADIAQLNDTISDPAALRKAHEAWMDRREKAYTNILPPYTNRYLLALWRRHLLPTLMPGKKILRWINYIDCEAHRDVILHTLKRKVGK